jgi:hypothetical protein
VVVLTHGLAALLARNGLDWHTLLEFCGLIRTLIIDEDGIYDPRQPNDRLLGCGSSFLIGRKN